MLQQLLQKLRGIVFAVEGNASVLLPWGNPDFETAYVVNAISTVSAWMLNDILVGDDH
jgi:hypothetical protein